MEGQQMNVPMGGAAAAFPRQAGKQFGVYNFKYYTLWYLPFSELLLLSVSCKTSYAKILAQRKHAYQ